MATRIVQEVLALSHSISLTNTTLLVYILPPFLCQYLLGVLVQLEGTRPYRLALLPVMLCLAWRATLVDMSGGDPTKIQANSMLVTQMASMATRSAVWAISRKRYQRRINHQNRSDLGSLYTACWNTWDLLLSPRGIGWNWPRGLVIPKPALKTESRVEFALSSLPSCVVNMVVFDACVQLTRAMSPDTFGSVKGGSLFDHTLPPPLELVRAISVSFLAAAQAYFGLQYTYKFIATVCVLVFRQHPSQWPPLFDAPWMATSLSELWGRRWHQLMRDMLLHLGYDPFCCVFGPLGGLVGVFFVSGLFHNAELGRGGHLAVVLGFWVMNGVGVALERVWNNATGKRVGGLWGRVWMMGWLLIWGVPMTNVYAKVGRFATLSVVGGFEPSLIIAGMVRRCADSILDVHVKL